MSRSIQRSKCTRVGCLACKPHKWTGERPIGEASALTVAQDVAAVDHMDWRDVFHPGGIDHADPWWRECDVCGSDVTYDTCECLNALSQHATAPLTHRPFAEAA